MKRKILKPVNDHLSNLGAGTAGVKCSKNKKKRQTNDRKIDRTYSSTTEM